jgi:retron-type reverse transcriptase
VGEISNCFLSSELGKKNRQTLINILQESIRDKLILNLIKASLSRKIYHEGPLLDSESMGIRQGGIIYPLLCNILLSKLDQKIRE